MPNSSLETIGQPRILVIDDNPSVHEAFDEILRRETPNEKLEQEEEIMFGAPSRPRIVKPAWQIDHALSGADGVEKVRAAQLAGTPYQLAFVDIRMPGMDGVETIERCWQLDTQVQTVICTAYADYRWEDLAARLGQTDRLLVLKKPFHDIEVMQLASTLIRKWYLAQAAAMKMEEAERLVARRTESLVEFQRREHQRIQELDQTKLRHLTQLAREFGAPLTVMLQVLEQCQPGQPLDATARDTLGRNAQTLRTLVDQSLSLRRLELEDRAVEWQEIEIVAFVRGVVQMFSATGREQRVAINFQPPPPARVIWTDPAKLEKVLFNVIGRVSAAVSPGRGILVGLKFDDGQARLRLDFELARVAGGEAIGGGGDIGWLLSGEILRLLGGRLHLESPENSEGDWSRQGILLEFPVVRPEPAAAEAPAAGMTVVPSTAAAERELPVALLVESNAELRQFIRQGLGVEYAVLEAVEAVQGLAVAREDVPDLIVIGGDGSPNDGVELCRNLKREEMTSHIPVILLAGDDSDASRLLALQAGANEFLAKPFRLPLLKACADNLLANRRKLHEHFQHLATVQPRELAANQVDAEFLRKIVVIVEKSLADYEFDVDQLARQMAVSRRQLFRKFKAVAGCTPNVFIRDLRLKRAAQLLRESQLTVSEIIYAVGFSDPKYFRTIFRERFGVLPGEYSKPTKADA